MPSYLSLGAKTFLLLLLLVVGFSSPVEEATHPSRSEDGDVDPDFSGVTGENRPLKIAAFNIRIFGKKKMAQPDVVQILIKILLRYDLVLIQEIRDSEEKSTKELLDRLNETVQEDAYEMIISDRLGRSQSKEQYAFFYRKRLLSVKNSFHYDDGIEIDKCQTAREKAKNDAKNNTTDADNGKDKPVCVDTFQREPFVVRFYSPTTVIKDFSVTACHTDPDEAVQEIDALYDVYKKVKSRWGTTEVLIAGDLNADGNYMPRKSWPDIRLRNERYWNWLIPDTADTTTGNTDCAYDRFIVSKRSRLSSAVGVIPESVRVFDYRQFFGLDDDLTMRVSDHYPIELQLLPALSSLHVA